MLNSNAPFFSVVVPLYNKENYIKKTIDSVLNQTYNDFELIVINDGSTDKSLSVVEKYDLKHLTIISQKNRGLSASRNKGFSVSKGKLVAFLDADDWWVPKYLETIKYLYDKFPEASIFGTSYFEKRNDVLLEARLNISNHLKNLCFIADNFFQINYRQFIPCQSTLALKKVDFSNPVYNEFLTYHEDVDFYLNYCTTHKVALCYKPMAKINFISENNMSGSSISDKKTPDLEHYEKLYGDNKELKKYIDIQRYKYIIKSKYEKNSALKKQLMLNLNLNNLSLLQRLMIRLPLKVLKPLRILKFAFLKYKIRLATN